MDKDKRSIDAFDFSLNMDKNLQSINVFENDGVKYIVTLYNAYNRDYSIDLDTHMMNGGFELEDFESFELSHLAKHLHVNYVMDYFGSPKTCNELAELKKQYLKDKEYDKVDELHSIVIGKVHQTINSVVSDICKKNPEYEISENMLDYIPHKRIFMYIGYPVQ